MIARQDPDMARVHRVTFVYGARGESHNDAVVLKNVLFGSQDPE